MEYAVLIGLFGGCLLIAYFAKRVFSRLAGARTSHYRLMAREGQNVEVLLDDITTAQSKEGLRGMFDPGKTYTLQKVRRNGKLGKVIWKHKTRRKVTKNSEFSR